MKTPLQLLSLALCHGLLALAAGPSARADIPEPDNVLWGVVTLGGQPVTAAATNIVVEARKTPNGPAVASYRMGEAPAYGNLYSLRVPLEALIPVADTNSSRVGGLIYLVVRDDTGVRVTRNTSIPARGKVTRLDFAELDSDGDGMPDAWEQRYFGHPTNPAPGADPDGDGRNNRDEFLAGTDPTRPDGRHPADLSPADNRIDFEEFAAYTDAWFFGDRWTSTPTNIPVAYATRAAFLWLAGGGYVFNAAAPNTNAPLWWVTATPLAGYTNGSNSVIATLPASHNGAQALTVSLRVTPSDGIYVHAIEDAVPPGWTVLTITHGGNFDTLNRRVKWGPFFDAGQRDLSYTVQPPATNATFTFAAQASFDGVDLRAPVVRSVQVRTGGGAGGVVPRFSVATLDAQGPRFTLNGASNASYVLEFSTNLANWAPLQTITTDGAGRYSLRPPGQPALPQRFFRARTP